jgi:hypothetical protein
MGNIKINVPYVMQASVKDGNHLVVVTMFGHSYEKKTRNVNEKIYSSSKFLNLTMDFSKLKNDTLKRHQRHLKLVNTYDHAL